MNTRFMSIFGAVIISLGISYGTAWAQICVGDTGYPTLPDAVAAIGGATQTLIVPTGVQSVSSNLTIPNNITLKVLSGANITLAPGVTMTIQGPFICGPYQVFTDNSGNLAQGVKFPQSTGLAAIPPEWWGAVGDMNTDCTTAINLAINAAGLLADGVHRIPVKLAVGSYSCHTLNFISGTTLQGASGGISWDTNTTFLHLLQNSPVPLISANGASHIAIKNMTIQPGSGSTANLIYLYGGGSDATISGNMLYVAGYPSDDTRWAIYASNYSQVVVTDNYFMGGAGTYLASNNSQYHHNHVAGGGGTSSGVYINGANITVRGNIFYAWYRAVNIGASAISPIIQVNRMDQNNYGIYNAAPTTLTISSNRLTYNLYGYYCNTTAATVTLSANSFGWHIGDSGNGWTGTCPPCGAICVDNGTHTITNNLFKANTTNISGSGPYTATHNLGIDVTAASQ